MSFAANENRVGIVHKRAPLGRFKVQCNWPHVRAKLRLINTKVSICARNKKYRFSQFLSTAFLSSLYELQGNVSIS